MALFTGAANSFADIRAALFSACQGAGWTLDGDILSLGDAHVRVYESATPGLSIQGGTGVSAGALVNPSSSPRMGSPDSARNLATWPMTYSVHIFSNPAEVFLVVNFSVDRYWFLAFGVSDVPGIPGSGLWLSATSKQEAIGGTGPGGSIAIFDYGNNGSESTGAFFWHSGIGIQDLFQSGLDGVTWHNVTGGLSGVRYTSALVARSPSAWNSEGVLLPIQLYVGRPSSKVSLVADIRNARYLRVDNYEPGQVIQLGADQWIVYPFHRKNTALRNGGQGLDHTGTFGWAIRYDGV